MNNFRDRSNSNNLNNHNNNGRRNRHHRHNRRGEMGSKYYVSRDSQRPASDSASVN